MASRVTHPPHNVSGMGDLDDLAATFRALVAGHHETAAVIVLGPNGAGPPIVVSVGTAWGVSVSPRVALAEVLRAGAVEGWILLHRHVGRAAPSREDLAVTRRLVAAGAIVGVPLRAHLVVGDEGWSDCLPLAAQELTEVLAAG